MPEPMSEERLAEITRGHRNATSGGTFWTADMWIEELLAEVERQRAVIAEQQAEVTAMRPIVEAVADIENSDGSACLQLCDTMYLTTPTESAWRVQHRANCVIEQARAYVAQHPTSDGSGTVVQ